MENFYKKLLSRLNIGIYFVDRNRKITFWNKGAEEISGYPEDQVKGHSCADGILMHINEKGEVLCNTGCPLHATIQDGKTRDMVVYMKHAKGHRLPVHITANPIKDKDGEIIGAVEVFNDVSSHMREVEKVKELEKIVNIDPLTGLLTRRYAEIALDRVFFEWQQHKLPFGIIFLDVDHFKHINDRYGHDAGDKALEIIAADLAGAVRESDMVTRWGGDEFLIILQNVDEKRLDSIAEKIMVLVAASDFVVNKEQIKLSVSAGIALVTSSDTSTTLLKRADQAMYQRKKRGASHSTKDESIR